MQRTTQQNKALHKYFRELADECLAKGITVAIIIRVLKTWGTHPSPDVLKSMFQAIGKSKLEKEHTSEMTTSELSETGEEFINLMALVGSETRFPSKEELEFNKYYEEK